MTFHIYYIYTLLTTENITDYIYETNPAMVIASLERAIVTNRAIKKTDATALPIKNAGWYF